MARPADYPPPFRSSEFITEPSDPVDERDGIRISIAVRGPTRLFPGLRPKQTLYVGQEHQRVSP